MVCACSVMGGEGWRYCVEKSSPIFEEVARKNKTIKGDNRKEK